MDFENLGRVHFIGVGGVGMSALARFALDRNIKVSGSDAHFSERLQELINYGAEVYVGSRPDVVSGAQAVVYSSAVPKSDPELIRARELELKIYERHEFLGEAARCFDRVIAVAGTHGKTTVTAMLAHIFKTLGISFTAAIGGDAIGFGNYVTGSDGRKIFLTEACEYKKSLLSLKPDIGVVTAIELDHPDCYKTLDSIVAVFSDFLAQCRICITGEFSKQTLNIMARESEQGREFANNVTCSRQHMSECENTHMRKEEIESTIKKMSYEKGIKVFSDGRVRICLPLETRKPSNNIIQNYALIADNKEIARGFLPEPGEYNLANALCAISAAAESGIDERDAVGALESFKGVSRRFETVGEYCGARLIFDYAHHPTEIECAMKTAFEYGRTLVVFQPHTYSRTAVYLNDFARALSRADTLILMPTFGAREKPEQGVDSNALALAVAAEISDVKVYSESSAYSTALKVKNLAPAFDAVLFLGAGDIYELRNEFVERSG